jgi:TRAP-type C4-dicarboxylate transport system permease large subunit
MVNIGVSLFFAEISGSAVADVAAMGSIMIPEMKKRGYSAPFAAAVTSSSASLAVIIPPSIPMILYAASAETSVEQLFVAGFVPGFIGGLGLMLVAYIFARRYNCRSKRPSTSSGCAKPSSKRCRPSPCRSSSWAASSAVSSLQPKPRALPCSSPSIIGMWYRETNLKELYNAMLDGGMQTAVVMVLVAASVVVGGFLTRAQVPQEIANQILSMTDNKYVILLILNVFFLIIGFFLHSAAAIILVVPIVVPLIVQPASIRCTSAWW